MGIYFLQYLNDGVDRGFINFYQGYKFNNKEVFGGNTLFHV